MRRAQPSTALGLVLLAALGGLAGAHTALASLLALGLLAAWSRVGLRRLLASLAPLAAAFGLLLLLTPLAPEATLQVALRGFTVSAACAVGALTVPWPAGIAVLGALGLPRSGRAFLAILACHTGSMRREVAASARALRLRGGLHGARGGVLGARILLARGSAETLRRADRIAHALELRGFSGALPVRVGFSPRLGEAPLYAAAGALVTALAWRLTA